MIEILFKCTYLKTLKNPPQQPFSNNHYEKVDIVSNLDKINTKTSNIYEFYSEIKNLIISTKDLHLQFNVDNVLKNQIQNFFILFISFHLQ